MTRTAFLLVAGALLLSACAGVPEGERMTWGYAEPSSDEGPKLAYGVDGTDNLAIMLMCDPTSGAITFNVPVGEGRDVAAVKLRSGAAVRDYPVVPTTEPSGYDDAYFSTDRADPPLKSFVASGRLSIDVYGAFVAHDVKTGSERQAVAAFAKACGLR